MKPDRQKVFAKFDGKCGYCGCRILFEDMQIDHIIPKHHYRKHNITQPPTVNHIDNLMPSCYECNHFKGTDTLEQFSERLKGLNKELFFKLGVKYGRIEAKPIPIIFYFEKVKK